MKYKNKGKRLCKRQEAFEKLSPADRKGRRKPGSIKKTA